LLVVSTTGVSPLARLCYVMPGLNDVLTQSRSGFHLYVDTRPTYFKALADVLELAWNVIVVTTVT